MYPRLAQGCPLHRLNDRRSMCVGDMAVMAHFQPLPPLPPCQFLVCCTPRRWLGRCDLGRSPYIGHAFLAACISMGVGSGRLVRSTARRTDLADRPPAISAARLSRLKTKVAPHGRLFHPRQCLELQARYSKPHPFILHIVVS